VARARRRTFAASVDLSDHGHRLPAVQALNDALGFGEVQGAALTQLALTTLGSFDFGSHNLLQLLQECIRWVYHACTSAPACLGHLCRAR